MSTRWSRNSELTYSLRRIPTVMADASKVLFTYRESKPVLSVVVLVSSRKSHAVYFIAVIIVVILKYKSNCCYCSAKEDTTNPSRKKGTLVLLRRGHVEKTMQSFFNLLSYRIVRDESTLKPSCLRMLTLYY